METAVSLNLWPQILAAHGKIAQLLPQSARQAMREFVERYVVEPRHIFHFIYIVENYDASALSTTHFQMRDPFDHPKVVDSFWADCLAAGFLQPNNDGTLGITETGEAVRRHRWQILHEGLAEFTLLPEVELAEVNDLLARVVAETAVSTTKTSAWAFHTRQQHGLKPPIAPLAPLAQFIELRMDLGAFRDDAHLAAWHSQYDISPHAWELLGEIWQNETGLLENLVTNLARRGYSQVETAVCLQELVRLDWLVQHQERFELTGLGQMVRQEAETRTNQIFYDPWAVLARSELAILEKRLPTFGLDRAQVNH